MEFFFMGSIVECTLKAGERGGQLQEIPQATTRRMMLADLLMEHLNRRAAQVRREYSLADD